MSKNSARDKEEVWILLRGLARESRHWGEFTKIFEKSKLGKRVVYALDFPGAGTRVRENSPVSVTKMTDSVREEFLRIKANHSEASFHILGNSLGGMVAMDWVDRYRDFDSMILVNTSAGRNSKIYQRLRPTAALTLLRLARERDLKKRERLIVALVVNRSDLHSSVAEEWGGFADEAPITVKNFVSQLLAAATFKIPSSKPPTPVLILNSKKDKMVSSSCSEALAAKWKVPLLQHETAGHDLSTDDPEWLTASINAWSAAQG